MLGFERRDEIYYVGITLNESVIKERYLYSSCREEDVMMRV